MTQIPPPLPYASSTTDDEAGRSCPPWLSVGWMILLLAAGWYSVRMVVEEYDAIGQPMAAWIAVPTPQNNVNAWQQPRVIVQQPQTGPSLGNIVFFQICCTLGFCALFGATASAALWHWPRPMLWIVLAVPFLAMLWYLLAPGVLTDDQRLLLAIRGGYVNGTHQQLTGTQLWTTVPTTFCIQVLGMVAGLLTGRQLARLTAIALLPANMRAALIPFWSGQTSQ